MAGLKKDETRKTWFVVFPTYRYTQDVKRLARKNDLIIVDARFQGTAEQCASAPKLALKKEYQVEKSDEKE